MRDGGQPTWAWVIFGVVWLSALVGTGLSFRKMKAQSYLETLCYVLMGLTILIAFKPFYDSCGLQIVLWVAAEDHSLAEALDVCLLAIVAEFLLSAVSIVLCSH